MHPKRLSGIRGSGTKFIDIALVRAFFRTQMKHDLVLGQINPEDLAGICLEQILLGQQTKLAANRALEVTCDRA